MEQPSGEHPAASFETCVENPSPLFWNLWIKSLHLVLEPVEKSPQLNIRNG